MKTVKHSSVHSINTSNSTIFTHQLLTCNVFIKLHSMQGSKLSSVSPLCLTRLRYEGAQSKVAFNKITECTLLLPRTFIFMSQKYS
jgi:hypothetical protein